MLSVGWLRRRTLSLDAIEQQRPTFNLLQVYRQNSLKNLNLQSLIKNTMNRFLDALSPLFAGFLA